MFHLKTGPFTNAIEVIRSLIRELHLKIINGFICDALSINLLQLMLILIVSSLCYSLWVAFNIKACQVILKILPPFRRIQMIAI